MIILNSSHEYEAHLIPKDTICHIPNKKCSCEPRSLGFQAFSGLVMEFILHSPVGPS